MVENILSYSFIQNAIIAAILSAICCGLIGTYMVTRRLLFMGGGITHSSLGGIGLAYYLGFNTTIGALIFAVASAFGIDLLSRRARNGRLAISEDSATSIVWSAGMAMGIIFIFLTPGYSPNLMSYLFGNLLFTSTTQLLWLAIFDLLIIGLFVLYGKAILHSALDSQYAASQGLPVKLINCFMLVVLSIAIVINIQILGIMLMLSMLTIPTLVGRCLSSRYYTICIYTIIVGIFSTLSGLVISYLYDLPSSAVSICIQIMLLIGAVIFSRCRRG